MAHAAEPQWGPSPLWLGEADQGTRSDRERILAWAVRHAPTEEQCRQAALALADLILGTDPASVALAQLRDARSAAGEHPNQPAERKNT